MNKVSKLTLALSFGLMTTACAANTTVPDSNQDLMTIGSTTYTKGYEYQLLKRISGPALTMQAVQKMIYDAEIGSGDDVQKEAEEKYDQYSQGNEDFEQQLLDYGYDSKEDYIETVLVPSVQSEMLTKKYFEEDKEAVEVEYQPTLVRIIQTDSEENATRAKEALENWSAEEAADPEAAADDTETADEETVEEVTEETENGEATEEETTAISSLDDIGAQYASEGATYTGQEMLVTKDDENLPAELLNTIMDSDKVGVFDILLQTDATTGEDTYYVLDVISRDYDELFDQIVEHFANDSDMNTAIMVYYLAKYDFEVHDQYLFDYWKANNPEYLVSRPDLMESADE